MSQAFKKLIPSMNRILVRKAEAVKKTASGIILSKGDQPNTAEVLAVGPGSYDDRGQRLPLAVKVGDTVLLPDFSGTKVELADGEFYLYRDTDVLGVLHK
jgi:chaperonin GroES